MKELFTDRARFSNWLEIEVLSTEAHAELGVVPADQAATVRQRMPQVDDAFVMAVDEREATTNHDVAAFVDVVQALIGPPAGNWVHQGLTSSDVVDTAQCMALAQAAEVLLDAIGLLIATSRDLAEANRATVMVGRTHGIHAEPTTFGVKAALWTLQLGRDRDRLRRARKAIAVGKLSGAVGTYSNIDPAVERYVCGALSLEPVPSTQVIARDRHAEYLYACASIGSTIEMIATEIRHLQRTEVGEVLEPFGKGQKGSSAMPHKRNPIIAERLSGLARILRGYLGAGLEDVALWHERDISHSSVERVILPDASMLGHYCIVKLTALLAGLTVNNKRMLDNLESSYGLVFSQPVLLALVASGRTRDDSYRIVQRNALRAWDEHTAFRQLLENDDEVTLSPEQLDDAFDLERSLQHSSRIFDQLREMT